jgi:hypothetical protein
MENWVRSRFVCAAASGTGGRARVTMATLAMLASASCSDVSSTASDPHVVDLSAKPAMTATATATSSAAPLASASASATASASAKTIAELEAELQMAKDEELRRQLLEQLQELEKARLQQALERRPTPSSTNKSTCPPSDPLCMEPRDQRPAK